MLNPRRSQDTGIVATWCTSAILAVDHPDPYRSAAMALRSGPESFSNPRLEAIASLARLASAASP